MDIGRERGLVNGDRIGVYGRGNEETVARGGFPRLAPLASTDQAAWLQASYFSVFSILSSWGMIGGVIIPNRPYPTPNHPQHEEWEGGSEERAAAPHLSLDPLQDLQGLLPGPLCAAVSRRPSLIEHHDFTSRKI